MSSKYSIKCKVLLDTKENEQFLFSHEHYLLLTIYIFRQLSVFAMFSAAEIFFFVKKEGNEDFDVHMGCFDGAEVCKLVGSFILNQLKDTFQHHSVELYRDDGFAVVEGLSGPETERTKKELLKSLKIVDSKLALK